MDGQKRAKKKATKWLKQMTTMAGAAAAAASWVNIFNAQIYCVLSSSQWPPPPLPVGCCHWDCRIRNVFFFCSKNCRNLLTANHTKYIIFLHMLLTCFLRSPLTRTAFSLSPPSHDHIIYSENVKLIGVICKLIWEKCVRFFFGSFQLR